MPPGAWVTPMHAPPQLRDGIFVVTRYADVRAMQRHPDIGVWEPWPFLIRVGRRAGRDYTDLATLLKGMLFNPNHEEHSAWRRWGTQALRLLGPAHTPEAVAANIAARLREVRAVGQAEVMDSLCRAIPTAVTVAALGLSPSCIAAIRRASAGVFGMYQRVVSIAQMDRIEAEARAAQAAVMAELERARREPDMGLARLLTLIDGRFDDRTLSDYVFFLTLASVETVTGLLGNMILLLLTHPEQWRKLAADPGLAAQCVEEAIRYAGPMRRLAPRVALKEIALGGITIPAGAVLMPELEQAHHDPQAYERPELFDITRDGPPNMGFGVGEHACLGANLGRIEAQQFLHALLTAGPVALVDPTPVWEEHPSFRRLARLELRFA